VDGARLDAVVMHELRSTPATQTFNVQSSPFAGQPIGSSTNWPFNQLAVQPIGHSSNWPFKQLAVQPINACMRVSRYPPNS